MCATVFYSTPGFRMLFRPKRNPPQKKQKQHKKSINSEWNEINWRISRYCGRGCLSGSQKAAPTHSAKSNGNTIQEGTPRCRGCIISSTKYPNAFSLFSGIGDKKNVVRFRSMRVYMAPLFYSYYSTIIFTNILLNQLSKWHPSLYVYCFTGTFSVIVGKSMF